MLWIYGLSFKRFDRFSGIEKVTIKFFDELISKVISWVKFEDIIVVP